MSVCVPAYNEVATLEQAVLDLLETLGPRLEFVEAIIVDDGSTDGTAEIADRLSEKFESVKVIHHKTNTGLGGAYRDALEIASGTFFTWFPGDHENSAGEFVPCLEYLKPGVVVTSHHHGLDNRSAFRRRLSGLYTRLMNIATGLKLTYFNGLSIYPTQVIRSVPLVAHGFAFAAEGLIRASRAGCEIVELRYPLRERSSGRSAAISLVSFYRMGRDLFRVFCVRQERK